MLGWSRFGFWKRCCLICSWKVFVAMRGVAKPALVLGAMLKALPPKSAPVSQKGRQTRVCWGLAPVWLAVCAAHCKQIAKTAENHWNCNIYFYVVYIDVPLLWQHHTFRTLYFCLKNSVFQIEITVIINLFIYLFQVLYIFLIEIFQTITKQSNKL